MSNIYIQKKLQNQIKFKSTLFYTNLPAISCVTINITLNNYIKAKLDCNLNSIKNKIK